MTKTATPGVASRPRRRFRRSEPRDELLAGRAAKGDDAAFTALYERYYGPLLGYTGSILLDGEDARDATQNALESALRALPGRDTSRPLRPWLYKIAHNEAITIIRRRRRHSELTEDREPMVPGPEVDAERRRRLAQLVDDLRMLPERQRGALVMRDAAGAPATSQDRRPRTAKRATTRAARSSRRSTAFVRARAGKTAPRASSRPSVPHKPAAAAKPKPRPEPKPSPKSRAPVATSPASTPAVPAVPTPEQLAKSKLAILTDQVRRVIANAKALAASGTQNAMAMASSMLQRTLPALLASIDRVLAPFGLTAATASATASTTAFADLLGPLRGLLDSVQLLMQQRPAGGG